MFAITGGGTGGHLAIAKALAEELNKNAQKPIYIGSTLGQDRAWFENSPLFEACYFLESSGVVNKKGLAKVGALMQQIKAALKAKEILKQHKIKAVISVGGFSAGGASMAAALFGVPLFIHEQNAIKGKLNELLTPFAKTLFGSFHSESKNFKLTSYPVRTEFFEHARVRSEVKNILFLGGSQGARGINDLALSLAKDLLKRKIEIAHQCGERDLERVREAYREQGLLDCVDVFAFDSHLVKRVEKADLCVARSGASSLWEMCANGLVGVFVPYPYAAKDHQYFNALEFAKEGLGVIMREEGLESSAVLEYIDSLQGKTLSEKSAALMAKIKPHGAREIIESIRAYLAKT